MKVRGFITHKKAEYYEDCYDYFAVNDKSYSVAVSDGITQSLFPGIWAKELVSSYLDGWNPADDSLETLRQRWRKKVDAILKQKQEKGESTWMLENNLAERRSGGATLCAICFTGSNKWEGYVLGDSCLIEVDANNKIIRILRSQDGAFGNHPDFFDSIDGGKGTVTPIEGILKEGCKLLIVTDPFSEFLYAKQKENKETDFISQLLHLDCHEAFCRLVEDWRDNQKMHNDDSTIVIVEYDENTDFIIDVIDDLNELRKKEKEKIKEEVTIGEKEENGESKETDRKEISEILNSFKEKIDEFQEDIRFYFEKESDEKYRKTGKNICNNINAKIQGLLKTINKSFNYGKTS